MSGDSDYPDDGYAGSYNQAGGVDGTSQPTDRELSQIVNHPVRGKYGNMVRFHDDADKVRAIAERYAGALPPVNRDALSDTVIYYYRKLMGQMKREDIIISAITYYFLQQGYTIPDVAGFIGRITPGIVELSAVTVKVSGGSGATVDGEDRVVSVKSEGQYSEIKVRVFATDHGHTLKVSGRFAPTFSSRRLVIKSPSEAVFNVGNEHSYRLFRIYEQFRALSRAPAAGTDTRAGMMLKKYSLDSLPETALMLKSLGIYDAFRREYVAQFRRLYAANNGRTASQIAKGAMAAAQEAVMQVLPRVEEMQVRGMMGLLGVSSFYIKRELERW